MESRIESIVMTRTRRIRMWSAVLSGEALALAVAALALWGIGREVWVARVFHNAPSIAHVSAAAHFWLAALANTRVVVQMLILTILIAAVYIIRFIAHSLDHFPQHARS
jgi:hypothetical protein